MCAGSQALASSSQTAPYCYEQQTLKEHSMQFSMDFKNKIAGGKKSQTQVSSVMTSTRATANDSVAHWNGIGMGRLTDTYRYTGTRGHDAGASVEQP